MEHEEGGIAPLPEPMIRVCLVWEGDAPLEFPAKTHRVLLSPDNAVFKIIEEDPFSNVVAWIPLESVSYIRVDRY